MYPPPAASKSMYVVLIRRYTSTYFTFFVGGAGRWGSSGGRQGRRCAAAGVGFPVACLAQLALEAQVLSLSNQINCLGLSGYASALEALCVCVCVRARFADVVWCVCVSVGI